jgi:hypothetical protein
MNGQQAKSYALQLAKAIAADGVVDIKELRRIYEVMTAFEIGSDARHEILDLLFFDPKKLASIELEESFIEDKELGMALAKDVLFVRAQDDDAATEQVAKSILNRLGITPKQTQFLGEWVAWENKALRRLGAGEADLADEKGVKELASRAAAVGVPLSALYFAGTVGFGAVGITSGLAALGSASGLIALGLNPMTAGIAALIIAGVSMKKFCDFAMKSGKKKEVVAALERAKDLQERYRSYLLHDMTEFEKGSIRDWLAGKKTKREHALESFRILLLENFDNNNIVK